MKIQKIREAVTNSLFVPSISIWRGRIRVLHQDFVALEPAGREFIVYQQDNSHQIVDVMLVPRLEISDLQVRTVE
jgi:hypothetical protein